jgi:hypothetical protein
MAIIININAVYNFIFAYTLCVKIYMIKICIYISIIIKIFMLQYYNINLFLHIIHP